jgi:coatomer subunit beta'
MKSYLYRGIYAPAKEYIIHAERPNETLVEAFKNMRIHQEEVLPDENGDDTHEVSLLQKEL